MHPKRALLIVIVSALLACGVLIRTQLSTGTKTIGGILGCTLATYSFSNGMLTWFLVGGLLIIVTYTLPLAHAAVIALIGWGIYCSKRIKSPTKL